MGSQWIVMSVFPVDVTTLRENPGQAVFLGLEIGLPYNLAYTLSNPLGQALSAVSVVTLAVFFFMNMLWLSYLASSDVPQGRRKRSTNNTSPPLFDLEDGGVWFLPKDSLPCRQRVVCDVHALLADSPVVVQTGVRFITRRLELGQFKEAAHRDCQVRSARMFTQNAGNATCRLFPKYFQIWASILKQEEEVEEGGSVWRCVQIPSKFYY